LTGTGTRHNKAIEHFARLSIALAPTNSRKKSEHFIMTQTIATRLTNGQTSIKRPVEIPIYHQGEDIGNVTQKRICDCEPSIQELWIGHDPLQHIFLAAGSSFETKGEAIDYLIDCFNYCATGKVTFTNISNQHYDDDSDDTIF
jgi:hypothetical protein